MIADTREMPAGTRLHADLCIVGAGAAGIALHPPADQYRVRRFGGSTTLWGGRCTPFDAHDFESRAGSARAAAWAISTTIPHEVETEMTRYGAYGGHHLGTARMGADLRTSVVDANCRLHEADSGYIASAAVFPTSGPANPTLSIVALAPRLAEHLRAQLQPVACVTPLIESVC